MMAKYGIQPEDLYNFDETGFMMGMITSSVVVTRSDRRGKAKSVQPGNREWATVIECINASGWCISPFIIVKGTYHLSNWTTESGFPDDWVIEPTSTGWMNNEAGLDRVQYFDKETKGRSTGTYRMLIVDGYESHLSAEFDQYCKVNKIIIVGLPAHSSHLLQPLDVALHSPLKRTYGHQINLFIRVHGNPQRDFHREKHQGRIQRSYYFTMEPRFCNFTVGCPSSYAYTVRIPPKYRSSMGVANPFQPSTNAVAI